MRTSTAKNIARRGFTLVEILVVIAIIAVLAGLILGAVMRTLHYQQDVKNRDDLDRLAMALEAFKEKYGIYPPSKILLSNTPAAYTSGFGAASKSILLRIWPKIDFRTLTDPLGRRVDWSGGAISGPYAEVLEGHQCLVFFLGGMQSQPPDKGCLGFADSASNPTFTVNPPSAAVQPNKKVQPFFNFEGKRLVDGGNGFFAYLDAYHQTSGKPKPFAYFRSAGTGDLAGYRDTDCASLGVQPYYTQGNPFRKYLKAGKFQIISAGRDGEFGPGGQWDPRGPVVPPVGEDDQSNFHPVQLGYSE